MSPAAAAAASRRRREKAAAVVMTAAAVVVGISGPFLVAAAAGIQELLFIAPKLMTSAQKDKGKTGRHRRTFSAMRMRWHGMESGVGILTARPHS